MKLIVLYGQKDSGKTTTLKMVYEVLKKQNTQEEKKFTYLDRHYYNDFRDVLVIDKPQDFANLSVEEVGNSFKEEEPIIYGEDDNLDEIYPDDFTNKISPIPTTMSSDNKVDNETDSRKIGIILEGDYGCSPCSLPASHKTLFDNIQELDFCDIIICACSIFRSKKHPKPSNCIKQAIKTYHARHAVVRTYINLKGKGYNYSLPIETRLANRVLRVLARIW